MKKFTILAGLMALALVIGVAGTTLRTGTAQARPTDVISFSPDICLSTVINDLVDQDGETLAAAQAFAAECFALQVPANLNSVAEVLDGADITEATDANLDGAVNDTDTWSVLVDRTAAQLGADGVAGPNGQTLWVLTMVTNDDSVHLDADEGDWVSSGTSQVDCPNADEDCNADGVKGDGVVVDQLEGNGDADLGDAIVTATQAGIDVDMDYTVVGAPDDITVAATKDTIQEGADLEDCDLSNFTDSIGLATVSGLTAKVVDEDGTELTGIRIDWDTSDSDVATLALWQGDNASQGDQRVTTYTLSSSGAVIAPNLACGGETGTSTMRAEVFVDDSIDDEVDITVIGAPASMTLATNPATISCNGTNSSEVSATVLDSAGKPVVAGNKIRFEVVALGTADPIVAETDANGVAKTTVVPLSGVTAGVTVLVSIVDNTDIEQNILVSCTPAVPIVVPTVVPPINVGPPNTGDGGYLP